MLDILVDNMGPFMVVYVAFLSNVLKTNLLNSANFVAVRAVAMSIMVLAASNLIHG